jgi:superfamily II RNA helicase
MEPALRKFGKTTVPLLYSQKQLLIVNSKMTDVYEGSLIRLFRRLEELLRQIAQASKTMGSEELEKKFETALTKVRRDLVAAQSLYL